MANTGIQVANVAVANSITVSDRVVMCLANGAVRLTPVTNVTNVGSDSIPEAPTDGFRYVRQNSQWVRKRSGFSMRFEYQFDDRTTVAPLNSQLRLDNIDGSAATKVWFHNNDADGLDLSNLLTLVEEDFIIFIQDKNDAAKYQRYVSVGPMINSGTYCEIPVSNLASSGQLSNNQRCFIMVYGGG